MTIKHGIFINEPEEGARAIQTASTAVIGMVCTAADADADSFPLDTPVLITDVRAAIGKAGVAGTLAKSLAAIADQTSPFIVVVRVAPGVDADATETNIIGTTTVDGKLTGMLALLAADVQLGVKPKILGVPGLDTQDVTTALAVVSKQLRGFVYAAAIGDVVADAVTYRAEFDDRDLMLIWPEFSDFTGSAVARALGLRARIDQDIGWHKTLSNIAVQGVTGLTKDVYFDMMDATTPAGLLNAAPVTTLIRANGYRFWGNRGCSEDPAFAFESTVRTANVLRDTIAEGLAWAVDKPITAQLVTDIIETINGKFRSLQAQGRIIGANAWYDPSVNSASDLSSGNLTIDYDFTPCAPAENMTFNQRITDKYYANLAQQLANA